MRHDIDRSVHASLLLLCLVMLPGCDSCGDDLITPASFSGAPGVFTSSTGVVGGANVSPGSVGFGTIDSGLSNVPVWDPTPPSPLDAGRVELEVVSVFPARDARDAPRTPNLEITVSSELEIPLPLPVFRVHEVDVVGPSIQIPSRVRVEGAKVIAVLDGALKPGTTYDVSASGSLQGVDGQRLTLDLQWTFTTAEIEDTLLLEGPLDAVAYDPVEERLWGFDRDARTLAQIDLAAREERPRTDLLYIPSDLCVSPDGQTVYLVNQGSSFITELSAESGEVLRQIPWPAPVEVSESLPYHIRCSDHRLFVVDAAAQPGLWSFDLSQPAPVVTDHSAVMSGVGDLATSADGSTLYAWWQHTVEESAQIAVGQLDPATFEPLQQTLIGPWPTTPEGLLASITIDLDGGRVFVHRRVLDATDVSLTLFTFGTPIRAADGVHERAVTDQEVYSLTDFRAEASLLISGSAHRFFDTEGSLHFVAHDPSPRLVTQRFELEEPDSQEEQEASNAGEPDIAASADAGVPVEDAGVILEDASALPADAAALDAESI